MLFDNTLNKEDILSVSDINRVIKNLINQGISEVWIEGEIANYTSHSSGHIYFSLKDKDSTLRCSFFRQYNYMNKTRLKSGDKVVCFGKIDVYEKSGSYQLIVRKVIPAGIGDLQLKFLALKEKLEKEGMFDQIHKKPIPKYPESIGIITSPTGAAFQDIKNVISRRFPSHIYLYPAAVQGDKAPQELIAGLDYFARYKKVDLIIIGRGGGSQEDLFCFNDEGLARAIFRSEIPIISAVGHEIDFTISDFVADLRAPTPSAAAELAVPDKDELLHKLSSYERAINSETSRVLLTYKNILESSKRTLFQYHPQTLLFKYQQMLDELTQNFFERVRDVGQLRVKLDTMRGQLLLLAKTKSAEHIRQADLKLHMLSSKLEEFTADAIEEKREIVNNLDQELSKLSPYEALKRGYAILRQSEKLIRTVNDVNLNQRMEILLKDGKCECKVEKIEKKSS
ncbi:MAG: exodeoxyribonuclease VII large subunit [Candidatus Cloacimonadia bacterium]